MSGERVDRQTRTMHVAAPAGVVYAVFADAARLPLYFSPSVHVERLEFDGERERLRMWFLMDGQLKAWTSWRHLDPVERRIEFRQELPAAPLTSMGGILDVRSTGAHSSRLELAYDFSVTGDLPEDRAWAQRATDANSRVQLAELKSFAERWTRLDDLVMSFEDTLRVNGPAELVYDFLYRAADWPDLVPHVTGVDLTEDTPGVQRLTTRTLTEYGAHTTDAVRICFPHAGRIVHKQTAPHTLLEAHTGEWSVVSDASGTTVTAQHSVVLREENIAAVLGEHADLAQARRYVREELGRDSRALLAHAKRHAESAVRML
ncbi:aromatase/cyclase [Streptomyces asoensis]|uniref:Actinorhodin polyketide synthase bifunctional cyclase/dehydratase n=1 Tax=Streptomyces asoensis TaxID=249586 RepID=A0ABQ3SDQ6_9ACTN|nr:aromatase/cyclase [Streptomyces asoensis]GGR01483.1 actinorhodin polyketide synthase bifunctional cyclase/dehydratase [Streptomyces asoensis]GHI66045.1 actinorhodin polyketide synthase bifunctional cyclase/dehydratase [Streptomyces asoensis]